MRVRVGARGAIALSQLLIAGGIVAGGVGAGVGLQQAGVIGGGDETVEVALDAVPTLDCPGGSETGELHRGDRVLATAKDEPGEFIEVRDPRNLSDRVWVDTRYLVPDASLSGLDVHECAVPTAVAPPTTLAPGVTTTTEGGGGSSGGGGGSTGGGGGGTTPTTPADTAGPTIGPIGANPTAIKEQYNDGTGFNCGGPSTSTISAAVSDPSGVASVTMAWQVSTTSGSKPMAGGGTYSATLGPFNQSTIPQSTSAQINVTVTASDTKGNSRVATRTVTLNDCTFI